MTPNPDFMVTPLFDVEYFRNGTAILKTAPGTSHLIMYIQATVLARNSFPVLIGNSVKMFHKISEITTTHRLMKLMQHQFKTSNSLTRVTTLQTI